MTSTTNLSTGLTAGHRERLMSVAREVSFDTGTRIFEEGRRADRFWVVRTGTVALDLRVPGRRAAVVESLGHGELIGWSWHFPPHVWHLGAEAMSPVRAYEFDAQAVLNLCEEEPELGVMLVRNVAEVLAHRLEMTRGKLMEQYTLHRRGAL
ncbi:cyclic nucleotide-binding domain-containing protein [Streptomyces sp. NRRL S-146]|uniref:cyclic nucleotide-binding domain-containing protein n=1 Tax=Streptomyces sp. NRRL S-146 TaxID=1463884 RepID=UPI0004C4BEB3|nr:cyclic nucleotide-binding domain-containing protein [Streptomyces sp. NRRL S-146]